MYTTSNWIVGGLMSLLGLLGLYLAANAADGAIYLFGMVLFLGAIAFDFALIRRFVGREVEE